MMNYRLGIDVGGTNTDAVILDSSLKVIAKSKHPTTLDISMGISNAINDVLSISQIDPSEITFAMLGTTHATNAIVQRAGLSKVGVLRMGSPCGLALPPMLDWPEDIKAIIGNRHRMVRGGFEFNGKVITQPDRREIREALLSLMEEGAESIAISCVFSPVNNEQELMAESIAYETLGSHIPISISSEVGSLALLERENATILNSAILKVSGTAYNAFKNILKEHSIYAELFITQNDGTLMSVDYALKYPVFTIASGPTNSLRGAAFLSGMTDCIVVDVGGTTTDVGVLKGGFPRESSIAVEIGGVRTNFRMPDLISIGLGGGSIIEEKNGDIQIGPSSVGYNIHNDALIFGGKTLTTTDIAVLSQSINLGEKNFLRNIEDQFVLRVLSKIRETVEKTVDRMKIQQGETPVVLVGGGSIIIPSNMKSLENFVIPEHFDVANAIGAAISQISGSVDGVFDVAKKTRTEVMEDVKALAISEAVKSGACPETVSIVEFEEIPLAYLPSNAVRIRVKAIGDLKI